MIKLRVGKALGLLKGIISNITDDIGCDAAVGIGHADFPESPRQDDHKHQQYQGPEQGRVALHKGVIDNML